LTLPGRTFNLLVMSEQYCITHETKGVDQYYMVRWSPYYRLDKYLIRNKIPSESGIYQVYQKELHNLVLLETNLAYYGGIRGTFSELVDPYSPQKYAFRDILLNGECYGRFTLSPQMKFLEDVKAYLNHEELAITRESEIFVDEKDTNGIIRLEEDKAASKEDGKKISFFVGYDVNRYSQGK
jgi:hypothetical protein